ncbi:MAG TPA: alpha-L-fucosidase [Draconibacterium sp.]|nr:alpha-L-fucosidase [Draconibacterium sp.]
MKKIFALLLICISTLNISLKAQETSEKKEKRMQWFEDAKLGIFIHWGIYAVNGIDESRFFYNGYISYDDYMKQLNGFTQW